MEDHLDKECPNRQVACPFSTMGCETTFRITDEKEHLNERTTAHLSALANYTIQQTAKLEEVAKTAEEVKGRTEDDRAKEKRRGKRWRSWKRR